MSTKKDGSVENTTLIITDTDKLKDVTEHVLGTSTGPKIYSHAVFCQCILPVRSLPKEETFYKVEHGNASLIISAGIGKDDTGKDARMEVPAGPKARLLFPYIIDQAKRTGNPVIDMGSSLREYMERNNIPVGGSNAKEISRQVRNIAASDIHLGMWGETATHQFSEHKRYRVAEGISFWTEKGTIEQVGLWNPHLTISDEFMAAIENHCVLLDLAPLVELQANPRAMDAYTWLQYRTRTVTHPVKISYADLYSIFGQQVKAFRNFRLDFKKALEQALPYVPGATIDLTSDKNHIILKKESVRHHYLSSNSSLPQLEGVFGELRQIGLSEPVIKRVAQKFDEDAIRQAALVTKQNIEAGAVKNPGGFFTKALNEGWQPQDKGGNIKGEGATPAFDEEEIALQNPLWGDIRAAMRRIAGDAQYNSWMAKLEFNFVKDHCLHLIAPTKFIKEHIETQHKRILESALAVNAELNSFIITYKN